MTTSSKKKKESKKKDFQKPKLKVGKARPKAANTTDTSFRAKSIALKQQALSTTAPTLEAQCAHHLGLLNHKSDTQRKESLAFLTSAISIAGDEVVSCAGGWVKMLKCFLSLLAWQSEASSKWSAGKSYGKADTKMQVKQMNALTSFLRTGLSHAQTTAAIDISSNDFPLWHTQHHIISERSNVYAHLNLFGAARDEEAEMYEDREDRQRLFHNRAEGAVVTGLEQATKAGGEIGRAAAQLRKVVKEGMADFYREESMP
ncbi:pre-rrna-processing ipi1 [Pyrenophora seminiperda CCB06]|uniref:Pre-rrna-processing ipi1 n=1 Tax=Pyrenophora seminiperda CCB06 TaxID=1302712 RepID=A0A3M7MIK2_9PLEO|nr:pre-rrna-processing ipi1 [Pyrenophora seminiperda CCB06]